MEEFIDLAKAEPLHLKNNVVKERFMILFKLCVSQCHFGPAESFKDISNDSLFSKFVISYERVWVVAFWPKI